MTYLEALEGPQWLPYIVRLRDPIRWEPTRFGPLMQVSNEGKRPANPLLTQAEQDHVAGAPSRNNPDVDLCELEGRAYITYACGNQVGTEFLAEAEYRSNLGAFLEGWFRGASAVP